MLCNAKKENATLFNLYNYLLQQFTKYYASYLNKILLYTGILNIPIFSHISFCPLLGQPNALL